MYVQVPGGDTGPVIEQETDVRRRLALGVLDAAEAVALGVLEGLDACEGDYDGDEVLVLRRGGPRRHLRVQNPRTDAHRRAA
ncbi:hypothetical protein [Streptomyces sp. 11-1-2]|uniref:hypothetical protein n=1 Tax=unclassified Streptomyces TaxID=2593676 RepID=UPI0013C4EA75|nr:hypothetical protein [Streptomyces sp. 11-1-2]